jgi:uncharacterized LabA/DUF88 family protein
VAGRETATQVAVSAFKNSSCINPRDYDRIHHVDSQKPNYAFIDSQNLYLALSKDLGWKLDFARFRVFLKEKYNIEKAYLFIGYIQTNQAMYTDLQNVGFILVFKPTLSYKDGTTKGNCDAELVLQAMIEYDNYNKAVIVSGDGDFYCLADYLIKKEKLETVLIPNQFRYSALLKKLNQSDKKYLAFINPLKDKLERKPRK